MKTCFVIQPFDNDKFDKRYKDIFKKAIENAGLHSYRVDQDETVRIPINQVEQEIRNARICFAEITTDNPNVWYELGFAFASGKDVVMICSEERTSHFPFDIQHKSVIKYKTGSVSDFEILSDKITSRLKAYLKSNIASNEVQGSLFTIKSFAGEYKFFMPGQIPPGKYDPLYLNSITIYTNGKIKFHHALLKKDFSGYALVKDKNTLQIMVLTSDAAKKKSFEYAISLKINNYGPEAIHFPGITLSFDGEGNIISYPILLTSDLSLTKTDLFIETFFETCYDNLAKRAFTGRLVCESPLKVLDLWTMARKKI